MHPQIEAIFDDADSRYLKVEELKLVAQYVSSVPARLAAYRSLRDHELEIMQWVSDQLQAELPHENTENLERSLKHALLMLRHCGMAMLLNEETIVKERFLNWVVPLVEVYHTQAIDSRLYQLLNQRLDQVLGKHIVFLSPLLLMAQTALLPQSDEPAELANDMAISW
jgi:Phycobilisome protein